MDTIICLDSNSNPNLLPRWRPAIALPEVKRGLSGSAEVVPRVCFSTQAMLLGTSTFQALNINQTKTQQKE